MAKTDSGSTYRPTFSQREGIEEVPVQLKPKEISRTAANLLWHVVNKSIEASTRAGTMDSYIAKPWFTIIRDWLVRQGMRSDEISVSWNSVKASILPMFMGVGQYHLPLGFIEFVLHHESRPANFNEEVGQALIESRMAYRVVDNDLLPIFSDEEAVTIEKVLNDLTLTPYAGARKHIKNSVQALVAGNFADSVRESIHAIESVASLLAQKSKSELGPALNALDEKKVIHGALAEGFKKLYGWSSDEKGIRHALLEDGDSKVDVADAAFMLGASAAFVSYLINKGRDAGLLSE